MTPHPSPTPTPALPKPSSHAVPPPYSRGTQLVDSSNVDVGDDVVQLVTSCGLRRLSVFYGGGRALESGLVALGLSRQPTIAHYAAILRASAAHGPPSDPTCAVATYRILCNLGYADHWAPHQTRDDGAGAPEPSLPHREGAAAALDDADDDDGDDDGDGGGDDEADSDRERATPQAALRAQLAAALGSAKVFPSACGSWQSMDDLLFFVPAPPDPSSPRSAEVERWSDAVLRHCVEVRLPPAKKALLRIRSLEESLSIVYREVLGVRDLTQAYQEVVLAGAAGGDEPYAAKQSAAMCAAVGALQRFTLTYHLADAQRAACATLYRALRVQHVGDLALCVEVRCPSGALLERAPGHPCSSHLENAPAWVRPLHLQHSLPRDDASGDGDGSHTGDNGPLLYLTRSCDPGEALARELCKLLPPGQPATVLLILMDLLEQVCHHAPGRIA